MGSLGDSKPCLSRPVWGQDGCIGNYKPSTYKQYEDHVTNLVRALFNQKAIKNFEDKDLTEVVYTKKTGGKLAMRFSKHVLTFKCSEFSSLRRNRMKEKVRLTMP